MIDAQKSILENIRVVSGQLNRASVDHKHPFRFLTLCTVSEDLLPEARMVVLRKCDGLNEVRIFTDRRSQKVAALKSNPNCRLFFWHPKQRVQISLLATTVTLENESIAKSLNDESAKQYNSVVSPGSVIQHPKDAWVHDRNLTRENFYEIICSVREFDALQLRKNGHLRIKGKLGESGWELNWISP